MLYLLGWPEEARWLLQRFAWAEAFWQLNESLLQQYAQCTTVEEILRVQRETLENLRKYETEKEAKKGTCVLGSFGLFRILRDYHTPGRETLKA